MTFPPHMPAAEDSPEKPPRQRKSIFRRKRLLAATFLILLLIGFAHHYLTHGGMIARQTPPAAERALAGWLVNLSIPEKAAAMVNPLDATPDSADVFAGRELYQANCMVCHGHDGRGTTPAGMGLYPPAADISPAALTARKRTDGQIFYLIRNGIRNTGMPGWQLPDQKTWQLVSYLHNLPATAPPADQVATNGNLSAAHYVGSAACQSCHADLYNRWARTPMANVVRDPQAHPEAVIPDFSKPDPLVKFTLADVSLVYGSRWKQRYFKKVGNDYYVLPAQWDVTHAKWRPYFVKDDWWVAHYPPDNFKRPTSALCDGCHSVNFNVETHAVTEWNVGCERCHGPGSEHVAHPSTTNIVNAARMDYVAANDTCIQCHSQGRPPGNPINGQYYDWPVGYDVTKKLSDYWALEPHKLGETTFTHFADGTAHKNRMQGNDFVQSQMYTHNVACYTCHDAHGTSITGSLRKPADVLCLDCHGPNSPNGPHAPTLEAHSHHPANSAGNSCVACHMPKIAQTLGDVNVRSHTFRFVNPSESASANVPNGCNACHTDKTVQWTMNALADWPGRSPWRSGK